MINLSPPTLLCPEWCECLATKESESNQEIKLACKWPYIPDIERLRFLIPPHSNNVVRLSIRCTKKNATTTNILQQNGIFAHLHKLKHLQISDCRFDSANDGLFIGLEKLKSLHLERVDNLDVQSLSILKSIEQLSIIDSNLRTFPGNLCRTNRELKIFNLSSNFIEQLPVNNDCADQQIIILDLSNNRLAKINDRALDSFISLHILRLGNNFLSEIQEKLFQKNMQISQLYLNDNRLEKVDGLPVNLQYLDLSNNNLHIIPTPLSVHTSVHTVNLMNNSIRQGLFEENPKLSALNLSFNKLERITANFFGEKTTNVTDLNLSNNNLRTLDEFAFRNLTKLHNLNLDNNKLEHLSSITLLGLSTLQHLSLENCSIGIIDSKTFFHSSKLTSLNLAKNFLGILPESLLYLKFLQNLNLSGNILTTISDYSFWKMKNLHSIDLSNNKIDRLNRFTFDRAQNLRYLNLSGNSVEILEPNSLDGALILEYLDISKNYLRDINGVFANLHKLQILNVSRNQIRHLDLALLPPNLNQLDVSNNLIGQITNFFVNITGRSINSLKIADFSFNKIDRLTKDMLPDSVEWALFSGNQIFYVDEQFFDQKLNLQRLDLQANMLENLPMPSRRKLILTLSSNPLKCDCIMEWIKIAEFQQNIADFTHLTCKTDKIPHFRPIKYVEKFEFLCQYDDVRCSSDCVCCDFEICDCKNVCPDNCTCFSDKTMTINEVMCSKSWSNAENQQNNLKFLPMQATNLQLDGLSFRNLARNSFFGRYRLRKLYLNNSKIENLAQKTFNGLTTLMLLDLSWNFLEILNGNEFHSTTKLETLFLHNNRLKNLNSGVFENLPNLKLLTLHGNRFEILPTTLNFIARYSLPALTLGQNPWKCDCDPNRFEFANFLIAHSNSVIDNKEIYCYENLSNVRPNSTTILSLLPPTEDFDVVKVNFWTFAHEINRTFCFPNDNYDRNSYSNSTSNETEIENSTLDSSLIFLLIATSAMISFLLITSILWRYQHRKSTTVSKYYEETIANSSCGSTYLSSTSCTQSPVMKFDAFISYSMADENFVLENLVPKLQGQLKYKLCLLYRDLDREIGTDCQHVDNQLIDAMEKSRRILTVYSKNFIENEWEQIRIRTSYQWLSHCKRRKSILIILDDTIPSDHALAKYMRLNLCYRFYDKFFWENISMAMLTVGGGQDSYYGTMVPYHQNFYRTLSNSANQSDISAYDTISDDNTNDRNATIVPSILI
uniref:TIR domain-containing protein n=1 Tax=Romanomermis culicivorax TaxID=13658 RepID=A0A915KPH3_ROMCU